MFDIATRSPSPGASATMLVGVPFDWRLAVAGGVRAWPGMDYGDGSAAPAALDPELLTMYAMELEDSLATAVVISVFSDRRAGVDDALPLNVTDRRGWVGEAFVSQVATGDDTDAWGSLLWLLLVSKATVDVLERARFAAEESLRWMVRDGIADRVVVTAEWVGPRADRLAVRPTIYKPGQTSPVYDVLWGTSLRRWAEGA